MAFKVNYKETNLVSIQALRGIAASWVVISHIIAPVKFADTEIWGMLGSVVQNGFNGVYIFFVISGFIIPYSMSKYNYRYSDIGRFMLKRITRIEPPYIASIILVLLIAYTSSLASWYSGPPFKIDWPNTLGHLAYLNAFTHQQWLSGVYWTLAIEFQFYIIMALIYPALDSTNKKLMYLVLFCLVGSSFIHTGLEHIFPHMPFFILGITLFLFRTGKLQRKEILFILALTTITGCINFPYKFMYGALLLAFATLLCIQFVKKAPRILLFLGTISYSLYLVHYPVTDRLARIIQKFIPQLSFFWTAILSLFFIIIYAYVFYLVVEKPFYKLSKKIKFQGGTEQTEHPAIPVPVTESNHTDK